MKEEPLYIQNARKAIESMTNEELFDEMLSCVTNDASDMADARDAAYRNLYESAVRDRLKDWLGAK
jgi:hypothetical protein